MLYRSTDRLCRCGAPMQNLAHSASFESLDKDAPSKAETKQLVTQGGHILAVDSNTAGLSRLAAEVSGPGVLETFIADVSDAEQVLGYATHAFELWGQVDGFVNNAGIQTQVRPIVEFPEEDFDKVMAVNIRGVFL